MTKIAYITAIALALFSGSVSTYGLTHFAPGAEWVIACMGLLFEAGKLTAFAMMHRRIPVALKGALVLIGTVLMALNIVGVSGFLSNHFEKEQVKAHATSHTAETEAKATVAALERQLASAEAGVTKAREAIAKARGDRDQIRAVNAVITQATAERDRIAKDLAAAQVKQAKVEGNTIAANGELAAIMVLAELTRTDVSTVAHRVFLAVASLPELLAVLLLLAAELGHRPAPVPAAPEVAPVQAPAQVAPVVTVQAPTVVDDAKARRSEAARRGWQTRRANQARRQMKVAA
jgi:hypothetical protein